MSNQLPPILSPRFNAIPLKLKSRTQWVVWRAEWQPDKNKYSKIPINARTGANASSTDPATWSIFEEAQAAYERNPATDQNPTKGYAGIGFVLSEDDPFCGIDLDHVITIAPNGQRVMSEEAKKIVAALDTYAEVSPSGEGIRLFVSAKLPPGTRKKGDIECYENARFLTVTGRKWQEAPPAISTRQEQVEAFHAQYFPAPVKPKRTAQASGAGFDASDTDLLALAFKARNGAKIAALYGGSTTGYPGASEADLALCTSLAFWTGDNPSRLDTLFRNSGLMRDKWDERHYADGSTYGEKTVSVAIAGCSTFYDPNKNKPLDAGDVAKVAEEIAKPIRKNDPPKNSPADIADIPPPFLKNEKGGKDYAPHQIAALLGIDAEAPDTQRALAARAVTSYGQTLCHSPQFGFLIWKGKHWKKDDKQNSGAAALLCELSETIREEAAQLYSYCAQLVKDNRTDDADAMMRAAKKHLSHVRQVETEHFVQGALILARAALTVPWQQFEPKAWVIGFNNGVWDRGKWRTHRREDYMLELAPVSYDPETDRSEWLAVLDRITGADTPDATDSDKADAADLARTLQETAGYALSGASTLRYLPWLYGPKGSGKSTIAELLMTCLGPHLATMLDPKALSDDAPRDRLGAVLWGKRFAVLSEAGGQRIEAELLKTLSGSDTLPVRFNYQEQFTAKPTHLLLCVANDPPNMNAYDDALRDRVAALPCRHALANGEHLTFTEGKRLEAIRQNPESKLVHGFIAWAIEGLTQVYKTEEVYRAKCVQSATRKFWEDTDPLTEFWETQNTYELQSGIRKGELKQRYLEWARDNGIRKPLSPQKWGDACRSYGLADYFFSGGERGWKLYTLSKSENGTNKTNATGPFSEKLREEGKKDIRGFTENTPSSVSFVSSGNSGSGVSTFDNDPFSDDNGGVSEGVI